MKHRTASALAALTLGAALVLSGCGSSDETSYKANTCGLDKETVGATPSAKDLAAIDAITVTGDPGKEPKVTFDAPLTVTAPVCRTITSGEGDKLKTGERVTMNYAVYSGADASEQTSTWKTEAPESFTLGAAGYDLLAKPLTGMKVGTRMIVASPQQDGTTYINILEVTDASTVPSRAKGTAVTPASGLPTVKLDEKGKPSLTVPKGFTASKTLVVQPLIKGDGPEVESGQTVTVKYAGWKVDGTQFESSWDADEGFDTFDVQPIGAGKVIKGWDEGLVGQTVGSQIMLIVPPSLAYGDSKGHELQKETLIFVVDILAAS